MKEKELEELTEQAAKAEEKKLADEGDKRSG